MIKTKKLKAPAVPAGEERSVALALDDLCFDVHRLILGQLPFVEVLALECVDKAHRARVHTLLGTLVTLNFRQLPGATVRTLRHLARFCRNLVHVDFSPLSVFSSPYLTPVDATGFLRSLPKYIEGKLTVELAPFLSLRNWDQWEVFASLVPETLTSAYVCYTSDPKRLAVYRHFLRNARNAESLRVSWQQHEAFPLSITHTAKLRTLLLKKVHLTTVNPLFSASHGPVVLRRFKINQASGPGLVKLFDAVSRCQLRSVQLESVTRFVSPLTNPLQLIGPADYDAAASAASASKSSHSLVDKLQLQAVQSLNISGPIDGLKDACIVKLLQPSQTPHLKRFRLGEHFLQEPLLAELERIRDLSQLTTALGSSIPLGEAIAITGIEPIVNRKPVATTTFLAFARKHRSRSNISRGLFHESTGDFAQAHAAYKRARELDSSCLEAYGMDANLYEQEGQLEEALKCYQDARAVAPSIYHFAFASANVLASLRRYENAVNVYDEVLDQNPRCGLALLSKAECLRQLRLFDSSLTAFNELISWGPSPFLGSALACRGVVLIMTNHPAEADLSLEAAINELPSSPFVAVCWNLRAVIRYQLGGCEEAVRFCDEGLRVERGIPTLHQAKGECLLTMKQYQPALGCFDMAVRLNPFNPGPRFAAMICLASMGRHKEAMQCRNIMLELAKDTAEMQTLAERADQALRSLIVAV